MMAVTVRAFYFKPDNSVKVRRFSVDVDASLDKLVEGLEERFPGLKGKKYSILSEDQDNELVSLTSDETVQAAISNVTEGSILRVFVRQEKGANKKPKEEGNLEKESEEQKPTEPAGSTEAKPAKEKSDKKAKKDKDKDDWKTNLRQAVPASQRRWAKAFIQVWRLRNVLDNDSSTSSDDSSDEKKNERRQSKVRDLKQQAEVPDAFENWLQAFLPRWHKRWGKDKPKREINLKDAVANAEFEDAKSQTPNQFRKWVRWYLTRHFAEDKSLGVMDQLQQDKKNKVPVEQTEPVPLNHRAWAKKYIRNWRNDNKIVDAEDKDKLSRKKPDGSPAAPQLHEDYGKWTENFLVKLHGEREDKETAQPQDDQELFKDTVPSEYRSWVRHWTNRQFGEQSRQSDEAASRGVDKVPTKDESDVVQKDSIAVTKENQAQRKKLWESVPSDVRAWAKGLIQNWRKENGFAGQPDSAPGQGESIPDDFSKWMDGFLIQWHQEHNQIDGKNLKLSPEEFAQNKEKVDENFRKWTQNYMNRTYGNAGQDEADKSTKEGDGDGNETEKAKKLRQKLEQIEELANDVMEKWREMNEWRENGEDSLDENLDEKTGNSEAAPQDEKKAKRENSNAQLERDVRKRLKEVLSQITVSE